MYYSSIIETIGDTPLVKLNSLTRGIKGTILAKVEYFNPGNSVKDRMALKMVDDAEEQGILKPGGTIIEGTSGNTGMGLALVAIARGYKCIFTTTDKQSQSKIDALKALGAEVIVCPTNVAPDDPRSYYSVAAKLNNETPNSFYPNQYDNPSNAQAHYETTGPELWEQTEGKITHFAAGVGTGGTISGTAKYLLEQNKDIHILGVDTYGSVFKKYKETGEFDAKEVYPYMTEGIGEDILPLNVDFNVISEFIKVTDKDSAIMTRKLAREEGLFVGWSCGSAVHGALEYAKENLKEGDLMVVLLPDHGTRYLSKVYNDQWMEDHGFIEEREFATAADIVDNRPPNRKSLISIAKDAPVSEAIEILNKMFISQIPVSDGDEIVGSITDSVVLRQLINQPGLRDRKVEEIMEEPFIFVAIDSTIDVLTSLINEGHKALLTRDTNKEVHIITQADLLSTLA